MMLQDALGAAVVLVVGGGSVTPGGDVSCVHVPLHCGGVAGGAVGANVGDAVGGGAAATVGTGTAVVVGGAVAVDVEGLDVAVASVVSVVTCVGTTEAA